jgi:hypothetical protein
MKITPLIEYLKEKVPYFNNRIAGCVDYLRTLDDEPRLPLPAMYIQLSRETGTPVRPEIQDYDQLCSQSIFCFVELDNTADPRGQAAQDKVDDVRTALNRALVNYHYLPLQHPFEFVQHGFHRMDRARYIHVFEYKLISRLTFDDGYLVEGLPKLETIHSDWNLPSSQEIDHPDAQSQADNLYP